MLAFVVFAVPGLSVDKHVFVVIDSLSVTSIAAEAGTPWLPQYSLTGRSSCVAYCHRYAP